MNRQSAIDAPLVLATFIGSDDLAEVASCFAGLHGVAISVLDREGKLGVTVGGELEAASLRAPIVGESDQVVVRGGVCHRQPLIHEGQRLGSVVVGPYPETRFDPVAAARLAAAVAQVVSVLIHSAYARHLTTEMHVAAMDETFRSLEAKNRQLAIAIERMQEFDRLKSNFLATVSHELRTPLTSVIGYSEMLLEGLAGPLNGEQREYVQTVLSKADQLLQLITGILDASLMESGSLQLERKPLVLREVVESVAATFYPQAQKHGVTIRIGGVEVPRVLGDSRKIQQVLWNLVANAIKFTHRGGEVSIEVGVGSLSPTDEAGRFGVPGADPRLDTYGLRIAIRDSGIGISPEKQAHIFEPFFQVDSSSTREYGGTGLGLTLAKSYVEAHGGHIWVDSELGVGSVFCLSLPAVAEELEVYLSRRGVDPPP